MAHRPTSPDICHGDGDDDGDDTSHMETADLSEKIRETMKNMDEDDMSNRSITVRYQQEKRERWNIWALY